MGQKPKPDKFTGVICALFQRRYLVKVMGESSTLVWPCWLSLTLLVSLPWGLCWGYAQPKGMH